MVREEMARRATSNPGCLLGRVALSLLLFFVAPADMTAVAGDVDHGDIHVHDPLMVKQGRTYYVFSTGAVSRSERRPTWCAGASPGRSSLPSLPG